MEIMSRTESVVVISEETAAGSEQIAASSTELSTGMGTYQNSFTRLVTIAGDLLSAARRFELKEESEEEIV